MYHDLPGETHAKTFYLGLILTIFKEISSLWLTVVRFPCTKKNGEGSFLNTHVNKEKVLADTYHEQNNDGKLGQSLEKQRTSLSLFDRSIDRGRSIRPN